MANRSDFLSVLPRQLKRMLALTSDGNVHRDGEVRRIMIKAHKHLQAVKTGRIARPELFPEVKDQPEVSETL